MNLHKTLLSSVGVWLLAMILTIGFYTSNQALAQTTAEQVAVDEEKQAAIDAAIAKVYPALVRIHVVAERPRAGRMEKYGGTGSGTIVHPDGYVLTNHHVAGNGTRIWCRMADKSRVDATLIGTDPQTDLCIIKLNMDQIPESSKPLPTAQFGEFNSLEVGDTVLAMGSPAGVSQSVTLGVVANLEMIMPNNTGGLRQDGEKVGDLVRWIGHDAIIYFGNSGGPLVNLQGQIIGVNEIGLGSLGGAIPADIAESVSKNLIDSYSVGRSWTGFYAQPLLKSADEDMSGVLVSGVIEDSPATKAGILPGDIVTKFDGIEVSATAPEHLPLFNRVVLGTPVGKEVSIDIVRDGKQQVIKLTTELRSKAKGKDNELSNWGVTVTDLTRRSAISLGLESTAGVRVTSLAPGGPAAEAKPPLAVGDIIVSVGGQSVETLEQLVAASDSETTDKGKDSVETLIEFRRKTALYATVVDIGKEPKPSKSAAAERAWVGVRTQVLTRKLAEALDLKGTKGVRVTMVLPKTAAEEAGIEQGDVLIKIDDSAIRAEREKDKKVFDSMIREYPVGETVKFTAVRGGEQLTIECLLEAAPQDAAEFDSYEDESLEFKVRKLSKSTVAELEAQRGLIVTRVQRAGWAALAGLASGDVIQEVNDTQIDSLDDLKTQMTAIAERKDEFVVLFVRRGKKTQYIEIHPVW